jgi:DNA-binding NtrC family response regulator
MEVRDTLSVQDDSSFEGDLQPSHTHGRILLIDDEQLVIDCARMILQMEGFSVDGYSNPVFALDQFRFNASSYDLVITDLTMPTMSGRLLVDCIRQIRPDMPVVVCSGLDQKVSSFQDCGFLPKPFSYQKMVTCVRTSLISAMMDPSIAQSSLSQSGVSPSLSPSSGPKRTEPSSLKDAA